MKIFILVKYYYFRDKIHRNENFPKRNNTDFSAPSVGRQDPPPPLGGGVRGGVTPLPLGGGALRVTCHTSRFIELLPSKPDISLPGELIIEYKSPRQLQKSFKAFEKMNFI